MFSILLKKHKGKIKGKAKMEELDEKEAFIYQELIEREELKGLLEKTGGGERRR